VFVKLKEQTDLVFGVIFALASRRIFCANDLLLWMNFCTCAMWQFTWKSDF